MTTAWSKSVATENLINNRYRLIAEVGESPLGRLHRAQDVQNNNQPVLLLKLKQLITRLPSPTQRRLQDAAAEAKNLAIVTLLKVQEYDFAGLYIVMDWVEGATLYAWGHGPAQKRSPNAVIHVIALLARDGLCPKEQLYLA
ncbi:MAG: hypothetical protein R3E79_14785 [Caldilineaceae bacterium]